MEGSIVVTDPVPVLEQPEITSAPEARPEPTEWMATDGSGGGHRSEASFPWSLTQEEQVRNLKENVKKLLDWNLLANLVNYEELETHPWFEKVVSQLQDDTFTDSCDEIQIDLSSFGNLQWGFRMTSLDVAILMGDLKMVQKILNETSFDRHKLRHGPLVDPEMISRQLDGVVEIINERQTVGLFVDPDLSSIPRQLRKAQDRTGSKAQDRTGIEGPSSFWRYYLLRGVDRADSNDPAVFYTPLHLAVLTEDSHIVHALLEKGANVNIPNWLADTPLRYACPMEKLDLLLKLLEEDEDGKKPIHVAMQHGDIDLMKKLPNLNVNALDSRKRTPLHYLATNNDLHYDKIKDVVKYLAQNKELDIKALDLRKLSAFYVAILSCNTQVVLVLLDCFQDQIRLNEACDKHFGSPIQITFEGGEKYKDIQDALLECGPVQVYIEFLYRDRQAYVDAANAILVGAALIASVTFASWLQPPLSYTSYSGEGYSSSIPNPSTSNLNYVDVEHNIPLRAFWIFNALSFYFAIATVVYGARSVLPRSHLFIYEAVKKLGINLWVTSILLAFSVLFVIVAFAIAGTIVLTPLLKYQWYMIVPTFVGGMFCIISLVNLVKGMKEIYSYTLNVSKKKRRSHLVRYGYL